MVDGLKLNPKQEIDRACDGCAMGIIIIIITNLFTVGKKRSSQIN